MTLQDLNSLAEMSYCMFPIVVDAINLWDKMDSNVASYIWLGQDNATVHDRWSAAMVFAHCLNKYVWKWERVFRHKNGIK